MEKNTTTISLSGSVEELGYGLAKGALKRVLFIVGLLALCAMCLSIARDALSIGVDDSDNGPWNRSGLRVYTDARTGVQYLGTPDGGLIVRGGRDGQPITK